MVENWQDFLFPYQQAVNELKVKLRGMRKQFEEQAQHSPIEFVTHSLCLRHCLRNNFRVGRLKLRRNGDTHVN